MNKKGFTLIELIIVIAIMAILVGVLAPNLLRYIEKANRAADVQLANTALTAVIVAFSDPATSPPSPIHAARFVSLTAVGYNEQPYLSVGGVDTPFGKAIAETMGYPDVYSMRYGENALHKKLRSIDGPADIIIQWTDTRFYALVEGEDGETSYICIPDCSWDELSSFYHVH